jgi:hypothetical protein
MAEAAALWRDGRMKLLRTATGLELLIDQMTAIGFSEYDDFADAMVDCYHNKVYSSVWPKANSEANTEGRNPFDDVLKPGPIGEEAREKVHKMYEDEEAMQGTRFDVVRP